VRNPAGEDLGSIDEIMLDLESGRAAYAVLSFGGFLGIGNKRRDSIRKLARHVRSRVRRGNSQALWRGSVLATEHKRRKRTGCRLSARIAALRQPSYL